MSVLPTTRYTLRPINEELPFDKGFFVFVRALQLLRAHNEGVVVVGLAGASGSGKSAFSERVQQLMPGIAVISMDMVRFVFVFASGWGGDDRHPGAEASFLV